jgi:serralysin
MASYYIYDYLPDLTAAQMAAAQLATLSPATDPILSYESNFFFYSNAPYALLHDTFQFTATAGASYLLQSSSYFDPFILLIYDAQGNVIKTDTGEGTYGYDYANFIAPYSGTYYVSASWDQGSATGHKGVALSIWEDIETAFAQTNYIYGGSGNDILRGTTANDGIFGSDGFDILSYTGPRNQYLLTSGDSGHVLRVSNLANPGEVDTVGGIERIEFSDRTLTFEITGFAAEAFRLYQAAFGRSADAGGLGYYIALLENGVPIHTIALDFASSKEFQALYGTNASDETALKATYQNVLHRAPDPAGYEYWLDLLSKDKVDVGTLLVSFAESSENQAALIGTLSAGYEYIPFNA